MSPRIVTFLHCGDLQAVLYGGPEMPGNTVWYKKYTKKGHQRLWSIIISRRSNALPEKIS